MTQDAKSDRDELTEKQLYDAIHRLCHFVPLESSDNFGRAVQEFLVQHAMAALGVNQLLPSEVHDSLKNLFGLDFELREVEIILERMHKAKKVACIKGKYWLEYHVCFDLRQSVKVYEDRERKIIADWLKSVEHKHPELSQDDLQRLGKDLKIFAARLFDLHGAKCATLISANQEKTDEVVDDTVAVLSDILPEYPALDKIRSTELPAFFTEAEGERKTYIAGLLDTSFLLHVIQIDKIDKTGPMLIKRILEGCWLYLDTNVLYALFNLDTPRETIAIRRLVKMSQQLRYTVVVSTKTLEEFIFSLKLAEKHLKKYPVVPKDLAKVAANHLPRGFISAYWRKYAETGISREDFISTYQNYEEMLADYKIEIRDDLCAEVQEDPELEKQIDLLYASVAPTIMDKDVAEHDAFHRLLIKKLRGGKAYTFSDASAWFLTFDRKLNRYDYFASSREEDENGLIEVPFCILCDDWLQLIRPLLPRTDDDFDKIFIYLLSSPYFRSFRSHKDVPPELAGKIIGRISQYKNYSPDMAAKMLTDSLFIQRLETIDSENIQKEVIDKEIVATAERFRIERDYYKGQLEEASKTIKDVDLRIDVEKENDYLVYEVTSQKLNKHKEKYRTPEQLKDPKSFMEGIEKELSEISASSYEDEIKLKTAFSKIEAIGMDLYKRLFPEELKRVLWKNKDEINSIFIVSNEEWIPWEIIKPFESTESGTTKEDFWCVKYVIGKWLSNRFPEESIRVKRGSVIVYDKQGKLRGVNDEKKRIEKIIKNRGVELISTEPRHTDIIDILSDKEINLFHFACEAVYDKNSSDDSYLSLADGALKARDVGVCNLKKGKPIVFVNACESSITGYAVTGIGGFAKAFIDSGSSAFIGTMWKVPDEYALKFSESFYKNLFEKNLSIGEALQKTRVDLKDSPNPMWLAYSLYGFPLAKVRV